MIPPKLVASRLSRADLTLDVLIRTGVLSKIGPGVPVELLINVTVVVVELDERKVDVGVGKHVAGVGIWVDTLWSSRNVVVFGRVLGVVFSQFGSKSSVAGRLAAFDVKVETVNDGITERSLVGRPASKHVPQSGSKAFGIRVRTETVATSSTAKRKEHFFAKTLTGLDILGNLVAIKQTVGKLAGASVGKVQRRKGVCVGETGHKGKKINIGSITLTISGQTLLGAGRILSPIKSNVGLGTGVERPHTRH
ncbi:hypothetical protein OGAPHI_005889 [Ogataea philodendri]|uniref:Uncharacterized protein n=1 Tax=Ogataea philodendri TaxID=1378263 RepID=A0A9P8P0I9_9ASCO|nr:uncharacterized protein OGAPHI_005889 [Ogataea philodendri]KAH3662637.1 hypothetical protein OGAPHI_005889 [Ogataea philodendri]